MITSKRLTGSALAFACAIVLALGFASYTNHAWEDYYITFRSSKNLATGHGLVFNVGDRLHTFTSPLGVLLPTVSYLLTGNSSDQGALWIFRLMCATALGGAVALLVSTTRRLSYPTVAIFFLGAFVVTDAKILDFTINGMETAFMLLFMTYALWSHLTPGSRRWLHLGAAWAGLMWTRPDSFIYIALVAAGVWLFNSRERTGCTRVSLLGLYLQAGLVAAALYLPWFSWSWWYYGSPVPHTIVAKGAQAGDQAFERIRDGWWRLPWLIWQGKIIADGAFLPSYYTMKAWPDWMFPFGRALAAACSVIWLFPGLRTETRATSFAFYGGMVYLAFVPYYPFPWYFPTTTLLGAIALAGVVARLWSVVGSWSVTNWPRRLLAFGVMGLVSGVLLGGILLTIGVARQVKAQQQYVENGTRRVVGEWLHDHAAPGDTVFMEPLGYIGFFSGLKTYDWPGLSSREVSHAIKVVGSHWRNLIWYLQPTWLVMRSTPEGDLPAISPLLSSVNYEFVQKFDRLDDIKRLEIPGREWLEFDGSFKLYKLKSPTRHDFDGCEVASPFGSGNYLIDGKMAHGVHAPGVMIVRVPSDAKSVSGEFAFPAETYAEAGRSDGAEFIIYWFNGDKREKIFARTLHPFEEQADRGLQVYELDLPPGPHPDSARLIFETAPLATPNYDWTSWTKPEFKR